MPFHLPSADTAVVDTLGLLALRAEERDVLQLPFHAEILPKHCHPNQAANIDRPPFPVRRKASMLPAEEKVHQVESGGEVEALFGPFDDHAQNQRPVRRIQTGSHGGV